MFTFIIILLSLLTALYFYTTRMYKYWEERGVKTENPKPFFGNIAAYILRQKSVAQILEEIYWKHPKDKVVGYYHISRPVLLIRDPDIYQHVFTTDFNSFYARGFREAGLEYDKLEILMKNLFVIEGDAWRLLRNGLSPAFTSSKLKGMFSLLRQQAELLQERTRELCTGGRPVDAFELMVRYNIDFIGTYAFGIDAGSQKQEDSFFRHLAKKIFDINLKRIIILLLKTLYPTTFQSLKYYGHFEKDCCDLVRQILRQRDYKCTDRHDFINMLLAVRAKGKFECDSLEKIKLDGTPERVYMEFDDSAIAASAFLFFAAGFETAATSTSHTLHELAYNPEEQKKVQNHIDRVLKKHDNQLSYDAIKDMNYLEMAFKESLRIFPPGGHLMRTCRRKCTIHGSDVTVDEGIRVVIPVTALHHDPKYWTAPEEFRPERFSPENNEPRQKYAYMPFGFGPRGCIGGRLGLMQSLTALVIILSRYTVSPAPTSSRRPVLDPSANVVQTIIGGLPLIFTPRT